MKRILPILLLFLSASCEKGYGSANSYSDLEITLEVSAGQSQQLGPAPEAQAIILDALKKRLQISEIRHSPIYTHIFFSNGSDAQIPTSVFPFIQTDDRGFWIMNDQFTSTPTCVDSMGRAILPTLRIGETSWTLDGNETDLSFEPYLAFSNSCDSTHLIGLLESQNRLYIYTSDGKTPSLPIIPEGFYRVPDYWQDYLVEREKQAEAAIADSKGDHTSFVFFTDAHWGKNYKHSPSLIRHITDFTPVSKVFFGGDIITDHFTNLASPVQLGMDFQASFAFLGPHFYCLYGNHDNNSDGQPSKTDYHLSDEQISSFLQSQMTELDAQDGFCFYVDDATSKTRFVGLDTGRYYYDRFRNYSVETARFLIESIQNVPEGWHIIVLSHIWTTLRISDGIRVCRFAGFFNFPLTIMDDYNLRKHGSFSYSGHTVKYDFSSCQGKVEACIGGHNHRDGLLFTSGGIPVIIVPTDSYKTINGDKAEKGTITEQSISIITVDYAARNMKLFSIGRGEDRDIDL